MVRVKKQVVKESRGVSKESRGELKELKEQGELKERRVSWEAFHGKPLPPHSFSFFNW